MRSCQLRLASLHLGAVVVAEQVQEPVDERGAPRVADDLRAEDGVAELTWHASGELVPPVDREREHVRGLVHSEVIALQRTHLVRPDECEPEVSRVDALGRQNEARDLLGARLVDLGAASILDLDRHHAADHFRRCVPVSSACLRYASTMRCTSLCRTTSSWPKRTNAIPSSEPRMSCTWIRPDACSRGRSTWVTSPVTTTFEPKPSRVRNICICSGLVFCASSRMMNESLRVLPRMNASGATSTMPFSMYAASRSASSMS